VKVASRDSSERLPNDTARLSNKKRTRNVGLKKFDTQPVVQKMCGSSVTSFEKSGKWCGDFDFEVSRFWHG